MPVSYDINGTLVSEDEYLATHRALAEVRGERRGVVTFGDGRKVRGDARKPMLRIYEKGRAAMVESREFAPIGIGKPLTLWITSAYVGNVPPKHHFKKRGGLLSSSVKSWSYQDAKPRALNAVKKEVGCNSEIPFAANEPGTRLAFYSPALVDRQLGATLEMAFDNVDEDFYSSIGDVMTSAGALPVFASASPYLLAVGTLFKIGAQIANGLYDNKAEFQATETLNIDVPGHLAEAGYRLVTRNEMERASLSGYGIKEGRLVKNGDPAAPYSGNTPYVIVALDGTMDKSLEDFSAHAASAALLEQFYNIRENGETSADAFKQALKLFNDFRYSRDALDVKKTLAQPDLSTEEKARLEERYKAIVKNILTDEFKPKEG